jgi:hypothetical protein
VRRGALQEKGAPISDAKPKKNHVDCKGPVSLYPLTFETAVRAALAVGPVRKREKKQKRGKDD